MRMIEAYSGKRVYSEATRRFCNSTHCHPSVANVDANILHPWQLKPKEMRMIEAYLNCLNIPTGYKDEFQVGILSCTFRYILFILWLLKYFHILYLGSIHI